MDPLDPQHCFCLFVLFQHEPSGEFWETTYGESAWRMSIMAMCLPEHLNRLFLFFLDTILFCIFDSIGLKKWKKTFLTDISLKTCVIYFILHNSPLNVPFFDRFS
jgi:hypothetical protein